MCLCHISCFGVGNGLLDFVTSKMINTGNGRYKEEEDKVRMPCPIFLKSWWLKHSRHDGLVSIVNPHPFADQNKSKKYRETIAANMCSFCWSVWRLQYQKFQSEISIFETLSRHTHPLKSFIVWQFRSYRGTILSRTILTFQSLHQILYY